MNQLTYAPSCAMSVRCRVAAHAAIRLSQEAIAALRRELIVPGQQRLPASFLKHAEEQTIVALRAVTGAISAAGWERRSFADWGIVSAPNDFGRAGIAHTVQRYAQEGAWGISPQLIPHQSLHAVSGTLSQVLQIQGPNFGISGGCDAVLEAFLVAGTFLSDTRLPGLWLTLTGYEQEFIPAEDGRTPPPLCDGVALALTRPDQRGSGLEIHIQAQPAAGDDCPGFRLSDLVAELTEHEQASPRTWRLADLGSIALTTGGPGSQR